MNTKAVGVVSALLLSIVTSQVRASESPHSASPESRITLLKSVYTGPPVHADYRTTQARAAGGLVLGLGMVGGGVTVALVANDAGSATTQSLLGAASGLAMVSGLYGLSAADSYWAEQQVVPSLLISLGLCTAGVGFTGAWVDEEGETVLPDQLHPSFLVTGAALAGTGVMLYWDASQKPRVTAAQLQRNADLLRDPRRSAELGERDVARLERDLGALGHRNPAWLLTAPLFAGAAANLGLGLAEDHPEERSLALIQSGFLAFEGLLISLLGDTRPLEVYRTRLKSLGSEASLQVMPTGAGLSLAGQF